MGLRASKQSKDTKQHNEQIKQASIQSKKDKLFALQSQLCGNTLTLNDRTQSNQLILHNPALLFQIDIALTQLDRNGKNLIKADLVALVIALKPSYINMIEELQKRFTVEDLNSLLRSIIYDPDFIFRKELIPAQGKQENDNIDYIM
jgi:hypothetical protein